MLEIVFDENEAGVFLGQKCLEIVPILPEGADLSSYRQTARQIIREHTDQRVLIIRLKEEGERMNLLALALSVEAYEECTDLENAVFKVKDCRAAIDAYKPYMALANSLRYVRDLLRLDENERTADIKRLGYLGLKIKEDYLSHCLELDWPGEEPVLNLSAENVRDGLILTGLMKTWAICKEKFAVHAIIELPAADHKISALADEDEIIEKIVEYVRVKKYGN